MARCPGWWLLAVALPTLLGGAVSADPVSAVGAGGAGGAPLFAPRQVTAVRGVAGHSVTLQCHVLRLGDKAVSWVRSRDLQILCHGGAVFTADARVSVPRLEPRVHALRIDRLRGTDAGKYECQLNTEPKSSLFFDLTVIDEAEAAAETTTEPAPDEVPSPDVSVWAPGGGEVWAARGAAAQLACAAARTHAPPRAPPLDIRWLRDGQPLVLQDGDTMERSGGRWRASSRLRLAAARPRHAGRYTCAAAGHAATLQLHLTDEENLGDMEAMQRDQSAGGAGAARPAWAALAVILLPGIALVAF